MGENVAVSDAVADSLKDVVMVSESDAVSD